MQASKTSPHVSIRLSQQSSMNINWFNATHKSIINGFVGNRTPHSQVFTFCRRSGTYKSMLSFTSWALLLKMCPVHRWCFSWRAVFHNFFTWQLCGRRHFQFFPPTGLYYRFPTPGLLPDLIKYKFSPWTTSAPSLQRLNRWWIVV